MHLCFLGNLGDILVQFLSYGVSVGTGRVPSSSLRKIPPFVYFYRHWSVVIYVLISRIISGIFGFHSMKKCRMNEKCMAKPTEDESTSQHKKHFFFLALQPPLGVVFYSPLSGFSLFAYEVS